MNRPTLIHIETVIYVSHIGTFSGAARKLNATQPAISARVRDLESSLGYKIFSRRGRRMELTQKGRKLLEEVEPIFSKLKSILNEREAPVPAIVRLGCGPIGMSAWLEKVIGDMQKKNTSLRFQISIGTTGLIIPLLEQDKLDIAIVPGRIDYPGFKTEKLGSRLNGVWVATKDRWRNYSKYAKELNLQSLINCGPVWTPPFSSRLYQEQIDILREYGADMKNINTCDDSRVLGDLINASDGLGYLQKSLIKDKLDSGEFIEIKDLAVVRNSDYYFVWKDSNLSPIVRMLISLAKAKGCKE